MRCLLRAANAYGSRSWSVIVPSGAIGLVGQGPTMRQSRGRGPVRSLLARARARRCAKAVGNTRRLRGALQAGSGDIGTARREEATPARAMPAVATCDP